MKVTAPYNFVPHAEAAEVYHPNWAHKVSQDIPFEDGESGEIRYTIKAETPIFIRNGHAEGEETDEFSHYKDSAGNKQYFIPGSSIKGMIRNVVEIMSRGKMTQINDHRHSVRQIFKSNNNNTDEGYSLKDPDEQKKIKGGYLVKEGSNTYIYPCERICKIHFKELDRSLETSFEEYFKPRGKSGIDQRTINGNKVRANFKNKAAKYKYEHDHLLKKHTGSQRFEILSENDDGGHTNSLKYAKIVPKGRLGRIVASGQSTSYGDGSKKDTSRKGEYVFIGDPSDLLAKHDDRLEVKRMHLQAFLLINRNEEAESQVLEDWRYWNPKYKKGEPVPVFYRLDSDGQLKDFGLTFMYKEPVKHSTADLLPNYKDKLDLAEIIFGTVDQRYSPSKGRVICGHAKCHSGNVSQNSIELVLSSPRSSFTPFYLNQEGLTSPPNPNTFNSPKERISKDGEITPLILRGFKRYPIHQNVKTSTAGSKDMQSSIRPLMKGSTFDGIIRYHNLRPIEVGALLSALTFHGMQNDLRHSIGQAKPYGFGRIKISDVEINGSNDLSTYLREYESILFEVGKNVDLMLRELAAIASTSINDEALTYMEKPKDFVTVKNSADSLKAYSSILDAKSYAKIRPVPPPIDQQEALSGGWTRYEDFAIDINQNYEEWREFSEQNKAFISEVVLGFWEGDHRPSKKKLQKDNSYEWRPEGNITKWLGKDRASALYKKLTDGQ